MDLPFHIVFVALTAAVAGAALVLAPSDKRVEFLIHITLVTLLTLFIVQLD